MLRCFPSVRLISGVDLPSANAVTIVFSSSDNSTCSVLRISDHSSRISVSPLEGFIGTSLGRSAHQMSELPVHTNRELGPASRVPSLSKEYFDLRAKSK